MAGLLHDLGKAMIPLDVLNKPGKLTDAEFDLVKTHPEEGYKLLLEGRQGVSEVTKDVCLHHHEKSMAAAIPKGPERRTMSLFAKMGAVCDVYDAITSNRPYKAGWDPPNRSNAWPNGRAISTRWSSRPSSRAWAFTRSARWSLKSGKLGVVIEQGEKSLLKPKVKGFFRPSRRPASNRKSSTWHAAPENCRPRGRVQTWGIKDVDHYWG